MQTFLVNFLAGRATHVCIICENWNCRRDDYFYFRFLRQVTWSIHHVLPGFSTVKFVLPSFFHEKRIEDQSAWYSTFVVWFLIVTCLLWIHCDVNSIMWGREQAKKFPSKTFSEATSTTSHSEERSKPKPRPIRVSIHLGISPHC